MVGAVLNDQGSHAGPAGREKKRPVNGHKEGAQTPPETSEAPVTGRQQEGMTP
jgi:hypothetical protein